MPQVDDGTLAFAFVGDRMLVREREELEIPELARLDRRFRRTVGPIPLGSLGSRPCVAIALDPGPESAGGLVSMGLRELFSRLDEPTTAMVARASQTLEWRVAHAYCGRCGTSTELPERGTAPVCRPSGARYFPRINPPGITLVCLAPQVTLPHGPPVAAVVSA